MKRTKLGSTALLLFVVLPSCEGDGGGPGAMADPDGDASSLGGGGGRSGAGGGGNAGTPGAGGTSGTGGTTGSGRGGAGGAAGIGGSGGGGTSGAGGIAGSGSGGSAGRDGGSPPSDVGLPADGPVTPPPEGCSVTRPGATGKEPGGTIPVCCTPAAVNKTRVDEVFALLNAHRMANGRSALAFDAKLGLAMQGHCQHMATHAFFSHTAPESTVAGPGTRAGLCGATATGENIAWNQRSPDQVMNTWKNSPGHNSNMLGSYGRVGIGEFQWYWGQIFGR